MANVRHAFFGSLTIKVTSMVMLRTIRSTPFCYRFNVNPAFRILDLWPLHISGASPLSQKYVRCLYLSPNSDGHFRRASLPRSSRARLRSLRIRHGYAWRGGSKTDP